MTKRHLNRKGSRSRSVFKRVTDRRRLKLTYELLERRELLAGDVAPTAILLPNDSNGLLAQGTTSLAISFSEPMVGGNLSSNFELRRHGADGILGNSDDSFSALSATYSGLSTTLTFPALIEGVYRLTAKSTLTDVAGNALDGDANGVAGGDWVRDFVVNKLDLVDASSTITPSALVGTSALDQAHAVAIQADGKIVTAGISNSIGNFDFALARYNVDGTLDATFDGETGVNGNGFIRTDFGNASGHDQALGVAIQSDGKIVAVGYAFNGTNNDLAITRYNSNGSLDTTFSVDGKATYNFGFSGTEIAAAVAIDSQGRILVGGEGSPGSTGRDFLVARILPDGTLDTTFGTSNGKTTVNFGGSLDDFASAMFVQPDGKIVLAGTVQSGGNNNFAIARFDANGIPDTTLNGVGRTTVDFAGQNDAGFSVVVQADGKILVGGAASSGTNDDFGIVRLNVDGSLDSSFGTAGKLTRNFGTGNDHVRGLGLQSNGYIIAGGFAFNGSTNDFAVERYTPSGTVDSSLIATVA